MATLIVVALWWEIWLDYALTLVLWIGLLMVCHKQHPALPLCHLRQVAWATGAVLVTYIVLKLTLGGGSEHARHGGELELVLNYLQDMDPSLGVRMAVEDVCANFLRYLHMTVTNFLPPWLSYGDAVRTVGRAELEAQLFGYHPDLTYQTYYHYQFAWYLAAGFTSAVFLAFSGWLVLTTLKNPSPVRLAASLLAIMVICGSATHCLIKQRNYLNLPYLHYKCCIGIFAFSLLLGIFVWMIWSRREGWRRWLPLAGIVVVLISASLQRPGMMGAYSVSLKMPPLPDPIANLKALVPSNLMSPRPEAESPGSCAPSSDSHTSP